ncbi:aminoglycoside phosphotransferase family protein [Nonomuraea sp. NPDC048892]|uniref:phosphotransferase family protein n=1 Tax=Nonomuraea sp. NPDC048892 TaxID=3154624 RepID=UPI0033CB1E2B
MPMPMPMSLPMSGQEPSAETLAAIAALHGAGGRIRPLPPGVANHAFLLGEELVVRIPRGERFVADLVKEAEVIPVAVRAGVRTPRLVAFDDSRSVVDVPYMVLERAHGDDLARLDLTDGRAAGVLRQVGRELARLHRVRRTAGPALATVPVADGAVDAPALVENLHAGGWIDAEAARWLTGWACRLSAYLPADRPLVLVHGDLAPQNLLVHPETSRLSGIVDWGDAQWADAAVDFAKVPLTGVPAVLAGYREESGETDVPGWEARVLWYHLTWALGRLADPVPHPGERHWSAPAAGRLLGLLRFFASGPPAPWPALV